MKQTPTVLVVNSDPDTRESVFALARSKGLQCRLFGSADQFFAEFDPAQAGCVVTDLRMNGYCGIELLEQLRHRGSMLPAIVISEFAGVETTVRAMKSGAVTVLPKPWKEGALWDAIQEALQRNEAIRERAAAREMLHRRFALLTDGERDVLELITVGTPNKIVAKRLDISVRAVEDRRRRIMKKLNVDSFAKLMEVVLEMRKDPAVQWPEARN
jgi:FixJ family two-component response regulator